MIKKGTTGIGKIYHGSDVISRIYKGTTKVYEASPATYQEVKCIITDGVAYLDSNFVFNQDSSLEVDFMTPSSIPTNKTQVICYAGSGANNFGFALSSSGASGKYRAFYKATYTGTLLSTSTRYNVKIQKNKFYLDNTLTYTFGTGTFSTTYTMPFFAQYYNSTSPISKPNSGTKIYYIKIYDGETLVRDMYPCYRTSDNKVGMYDRVNDVFYTNKATTGTFTYEAL